MGPNRVGVWFEFRCIGQVASQDAVEGGTCIAFQVVQIALLAHGTPTITPQNYPVPWDIKHGTA